MPEPVPPGNAAWVYIAWECRVRALAAALPPVEPRLRAVTDRCLGVRVRQVAIRN